MHGSGFYQAVSPESLSVSALRNGKRLAYTKVGNEAHGPTLDLGHSHACVHVATPSLVTTPRAPPGEKRPHPVGVAQIRNGVGMGIRMSQLERV